MTETIKVKKSYDVVVVGGGMAGVCTALASARHGARTALIHNRPVLGGNASSEIRMHICGADCHGSRANARETGILEEILLENRKRNPQHSFSVFDTVLWEKTRFQENLELFLNAEMLDARTKDDSIVSVTVFQLTTEKEFEIYGNIFIDCTGDAFLAFKAGAEYRVGREGRNEFNEPHAPEYADRRTMGNTLMFKALDKGMPVRFEKPFWAYTFSDEDMLFRGHSGYVSPMEHYGVDSGYWWIELGGERDIILDGEEIRDELLKTVYGVWDHIKNRGDHGADNYELEWIQFLPGKRESRRVMGEYILRENDIMEGRVFEDAVAYGGWPMDVHPPEGFRSKGLPTQYIDVENLYSIPYRCFYSKKINNLMMAGRDISATHMAFGSVRVMGTCSVGGQAAGTAAAMSVRYGCLPAGILRHINELQQSLLEDDCFIPQVRNMCKYDKALIASVLCSSSQKGCEGYKVINGISRNVEDDINCWVSDGISAGGEWICLDFGDIIKISEIHIKFDSNLSREIMTSLSSATLGRQTPGIPKELVKDYEIQVFNGDELKYKEIICDNYLRFRKHRLENSTVGNRVKILVKSSHGDENARIFEVRIY